MGSKFGGGGGGGSSNWTPEEYTVATRPAPSAALANKVIVVTDAFGPKLQKCDGVSWNDLGAGAAAEGLGVVIVTASRNLAASDKGKTLKVTSASAVTLTLVGGLGPEFRCDVIQCGAGKVTIAASAPAAVHAQGSKFSTASQYALIFVRQTDLTDDYLVSGQFGT